MTYSLAPIADPVLGFDQARHLLNRSLLGATREEYELFAGLSITEALDLLLNEGTEADLPLQVFKTDPNVVHGETWVNASPDGSVRFYRKKSLRSWWIGQLLNQESNLREKMTLFWHNHFVTEVNVVGIPVYMFDYTQLIRQHALGNFKILAGEMTINTGMLRYLDGVKNSASSPNENYSRELFELFTIGKGPLIGEGDYTNYTESDVQEGARVLTGWRVDNDTLSAWFDPGRHDQGAKHFSNFYENRSINGNGELEYLDLIALIFEKKETARAIVRKLYRWFVYYHIDQDIEQQIIEPLADLLYAAEYDIQSVLRPLLSSEHFFDAGYRGCYIKNPLEFIIGAIRKLEVTVPEELENKYEFWNLFYLLAGYQELELGTPPDVAGWPAYYLEPGFNELWINSATLPQKAEFVTRLIKGQYKKNGISLEVDVIGLAEATSTPSNPDTLITELCNLLLPKQVEPEQLLVLKEVLIPGLPDFEWTVEWNNYIADPENTNLEEAVKNAIRLLLEEIMHLPSFYLM